MRKGKSIIGKDILSLEDGVKLDKVRDVVVDPEGRQVIALVVEEGGLLSSSKVVPADEIESFGKDAVVVRSGASVISVTENAELRNLVEQDEKILGKKVFTTDGADQGTIADVYFDEATRAVVGYEVSGGLIGDASKGTSYLATDEITTMGEDVIYIQPETAGVLNSQVGGIQGAIQGAGDKLGEVQDGAGQRIEDSEQTDRLIGKRTGTDVESDSGSVIVPKGRRVRAEDVQASKEAGKLPALTAAVAMGGAQDTVGAAGDSARSLWDQFTAKIGEMTDATGERVDEAQTKKRLADIADAVGRPISKVILDRDDNVVLNMGDIITHQAIQRAHESGGLESLLGSVYKGEVEFTKEEMRAPAEVQAEATVEKSSGGAAIVDQLEAKVEDAEKVREEEKERKKRQADAERERREQEREARAIEREASEPSEADTPPAVSERPNSPTSKAVAAELP